jgi:hypothetical protein
MAAAICFSIVGLSSLVPFGRRVAGICSAYISPLVGSGVGFVLLIFHLWLVQGWHLFCLDFTSGWFSGGICSAYISPLVGSVVGFVLLIFHIWLVQWWELFCLCFMSGCGPFYTWGGGAIVLWLSSLVGCYNRCDFAALLLSSSGHED